MAKEEIIISSKDGLTLYGEAWHLEKPKAVICIVHGFGEHIGRFADLMDYLNNAGYVCVGIDLRGHGKSEGLKGHAASLELLLSDIEELLKAARADYTEIPMFLLGHSMGGNLVLNYAIREEANELSGVIASAPWLRLAFEPPAWKVKIGKIASRIIPRFRQDSELNPEHLSKERKAVEAYENDPLVNLKISARLFEIMTKASDYALENAHKIKVDALLYHGLADKIIAYSGTKEFAEKAKMPFHGLENVYHEPHNDTEQEEVKKLIDSWIRKRLTT